MWLEQNRLISILFTILTQPIEIIQSINHYEICIDYSLTITFRKEAVKQKYSKVMEYTQSKKFKENLDKIKVAGGFDVGVEGFSIGLNFEFAKTTHTKNNQEKTHCRSEELQTIFQDDMIQIYRKTTMKWMIDNAVASHEEDEYVDTQMRDYKCDVTKYALAAMSKEALEQKVLGEGGNISLISGDTFREKNCRKICKFL